MNVRPRVRRHAHWWLDRVFLYVGRMAENKGVPHILRAWLELAEDIGSTCPPIWLVGGDLSEIERMRQTIEPAVLQAHGVAGRVKWWGYLNSAGISTLMLKTYVLITHSEYEPGGRVILEAMAQGIPVIATPHGFAPDLITDWHGGFLVCYGDVGSLRRRMEHFVCQPLLRHAMGRTAQVVASSALDRWKFLDTHLLVYRSAIANNESKVSVEAKRTLARSANITSIRGFGGVYPFESETVSKEEAANFLTQHVGEESSVELTEVPSATGRSRVWRAVSKGGVWIIKHQFSAYRTRPIWDRGYGGSAIDARASRVYGEMLAARCDGVAPLIRADRNTGLTLREWLEPAVVNGTTLDVCARVLTALHRSREPSIDLERARKEIDLNWNEMADEAVVSQLEGIEHSWRKEDRSWHAWQPISIRLGWRWLRLGLQRKWLGLPSGLDYPVSILIEEESEVASAESLASFGLCHGDCVPEHFRKEGNGRLVLIDCERIHPGYFGHDWASLTLPLIDSTANDDDSAQILERILRAIEPVLCPRRLLLSWLKWTTIMRMCRSHGLMEPDGRTTGQWRLRALQSLTV